MKDIVVPDAPYVLLRSKEYPGRAVESLLFTDYQYIRFIYDKQAQAASENPNSLERHLQFIFAAEEALTPKVLCPFCQKEPARKFMWVNEAFFDLRFVVCLKLECLEKIRQHHSNDHLYSLRPKTLAHSHFRRKSVRNEVSRLLRNAYGLVSRRAGPGHILALLKEAFNSPPAAAGPF